MPKRIQWLLVKAVCYLLIKCGRNDDNADDCRYELESWLELEGDEKTPYDWER